jgi:hypothetical protein
LRKDSAPLPSATARSPARTDGHARSPRLRGFDPHGAAFTAKQG